MSSYSLSFHSSEEVSASDRRAAEQRFRRTLDTELGDASLVWPLYSACLQIAERYGDNPDLAALTDDERSVYESWHMAHTAALTAALGPNRYLDDAWFEIGPA